MREKIEWVNNFIEGDQILWSSGVYGAAQILSSLTFLRLLSKIIEEFSESAAGFIFEAFLAGLLSGQQVTAREGGTLPIDDIRIFVDPETGEGGHPLSLKLLSFTTDVKGSIHNLIYFFTF